jgi:hypothetical protein
MQLELIAFATLIALVAVVAPASAETSGPCPGYWRDHIVPLACGGPDAVENMQWQTIAEAKAKDRWELRECGR